MSQEEVSENDSKDFISNIKDTSAVTLATDDDKQLKAHNKSVVLYRLNLNPTSLRRTKKPLTKIPKKM